MLCSYLCAFAFYSYLFSLVPILFYLLLIAFLLQAIFYLLKNKNMFSNLVFKTDFTMEKSMDVEEIYIWHAWFIREVTLLTV